MKRFVALFVKLSYFSMLAYPGPAIAAAEDLETPLLELREHHLHPTQFTVGKKAVKEKIKKIEKLYKKDALAAYRRQKIIPLVLGKNETLYMYDRHHTALAFFAAAIPTREKFLYGNIQHNLEHLNLQEFWQEMENNNLAYFFDNGGRRPAREIPSQIRLLTDDPYRSLAWILREKGHIIKQAIPFMEFRWADFFRANNILLVPNNKKQWKRATKIAIQLAHSPAAAHLPGFAGAAVDTF